MYCLSITVIKRCIYLCRLRRIGLKRRRWRAADARKNSSSRFVDDYALEVLFDVKFVGLCCGSIVVTFLYRKIWELSRWSRWRCVNGIFFFLDENIDQSVYADICGFDDSHNKHIFLASAYESTCIWTCTVLVWLSIFRGTLVVHTRISSIYHRLSR